MCSLNQGNQEPSYSWKILVAIVLALVRLITCSLYFIVILDHWARSTSIQDFLVLSRGHLLSPTIHPCSFELGSRFFQYVSHSSCNLFICQNIICFCSLLIVSFSCVSFILSCNSPWFSVLLSFFLVLYLAKLYWNFLLPSTSSKNPLNNNLMVITQAQLTIMVIIITNRYYIKSFSQLLYSVKNKSYENLDGAFVDTKSIWRPNIVKSYIDDALMLDYRNKM